MSEVTMPRLSDTMQEGTIARWLKKPGEEIKKGDVLAEIETDKATMDLEAFDAGVLEQILVPEGETVPIGQAVATIGTGAGAQQPTAGRPAQEPEPPAAGRPAQEPEPPAESRGELTQARPAPAPSAQEEGAGPPRERPVTADSGDGRAIKASPLARRMAEEHDIDLSQVQGTGPGGRIVRDDIEDVLEQQRAAPAPAAPSQEPAPAHQEGAAVGTAPSAAPAEVEVSKLSRVQVLIARRLAEAKQTIPHFYVSSEVDMSEALALRQVLNANAGTEEMKVTVNDLIVKACALALERFPEVNSSFKDEQRIQYTHIHVGIAVDVPSGLVVPVIRDTNTKGVRSIAREAKALIGRARANKLAPADLEGGTFSVSNLGMMDVTDFIAVINPPQAAILAVASTHQRFVPIDGQPVIRELMTMTLSADHRILYGATVARFLQEVKRLLQNPYSLLG